MLKYHSCVSSSEEEEEFLRRVLGDNEVFFWADGNSAFCVQKKQLPENVSFARVQVYFLWLNNLLQKQLLKEKDMKDFSSIHSDPIHNVRNAPYCIPKAEHLEKYKLQSKRGKSKLSFETETDSIAL